MSDEATAETRERLKRRRIERSIVVAFSLVCSLFFCNKAFHIDDPLYLSIARQILVDPLRPFDGMINWQQVTEPAWRVSISPPGYSYWLAAWLYAGVTTEWSLHFVGTFWLILLGLGTYAWAKRLGDWPLGATLLVLATPITLAGQNLMLDVPMLALAVSALAVYYRASDRNSTMLALAAGLLAGLSVNFKYAGVVPIVVMGADAVVWRRWRLLSAAILGSGLLVAGQLTIAMRDGVPQLLFARDWITQLWPSGARDIIHRFATSLAYLGAAAAWLLLAAQVGARITVRHVAAAIVACAGASLAVLDLRERERTVGMLPAVQFAAFAFNGGFIVAWLLFESIRRARGGNWRNWTSALLSGDSTQPIRSGIILALWSAGFWYLGSLNGPFVAPRALLPCVVSLVLSVLSVAPIRDAVGMAFIHVAVLLTIAAGIFVGASDYYWAGVYRSYAPQLATNYKPVDGTLYFLGHWGWQYYAADAGMVQFDPMRTRLQPGDILIWPVNVDCGGFTFPKPGDPVPAPIARIMLRSREIARVTVPADYAWLPRTRSQPGLVFLHGDTDRGRLPWGWSAHSDPAEIFVILRYGN